MFYRLATDGTEQQIPLMDAYAGPRRTGCWIIGGGPSLGALPVDAIVRSTLPKFAINLAGHRLLRPTFWTAYDPTQRFQRSTYLDPSVLKFVPRGRAMDLVPGSSFKVCDCPQTVFFDRDPQVGFHNFLSRPMGAPTTVKPREGITDWQDSLIQAIHIACLLGFRTLYLAGCEMFVAPASSWQDAAQSQGVKYTPREPLKDYHQRCLSAGVPLSIYDHPQSTRQYHFDEAKSLAAALQTDQHYYRVAQYLRLARRAMGLAGMELISVTPGSRLNDFFPYRSVEAVCQQITIEVGQPQHEPTRGLYTESAHRIPAELVTMRDYRPHHWGKEPPSSQRPPEMPTTRPVPLAQQPPREIPVSIQEVG
ncbi:MAG: hypothetical protein DWH91_16260 [Planctomycetota bacterium]|nr:MAG: hypothetical protein DWH91_16260 [Planctomycetota bacterium]